MLGSVDGDWEILTIGISPKQSQNYINSLYNPVKYAKQIQILVTAGQAINLKNKQTVFTWFDYSIKIAKGDLHKII